MFKWLLLCLVALLAVPAWWWTHPPDPVAELRARARPLARLERSPAHGLGRGVERWRMIGTGGDVVTGLWKPGAADEGTPRWAVVVLGGIGTDDRAALLVPDGLPIDVLAVSWPWKGSRRLPPSRFLRQIPAIRESMLRTPAATARGIEAVRRARPGGHVALVGASLGVPPTVAALSLTTPDAVVLVDGAADLERLLGSETARVLGGGTGARIVARPAGALGARLLWSLEPARHAAPRATPVLLVDAAHEERYPPECVARLHATFPGAARAVHPGPHVRPQDVRAMASIVHQAAGWMATLPR